MIKISICNTIVDLYFPGIGTILKSPVLPNPIHNVNHMAAGRGGAWLRNDLLQWNEDGVGSRN